MIARHHMLCAGVLCLAGSFLANAQEQAPPPTEPPAQATDLPPRDEKSPARAVVDPAGAGMITMLIHGNEHEIAVARAAGPKLQNAEVKKFAAQLIEVHASMIRDLQPFAPQSAPRVVEPQAENAPKDRSNDEVKLLRGNQAEVVTLEPAPGTARTNHVDHLALSAEMRDECIRLAKDELETKVGRDLDACFVGMVISAHRTGLAKATVLRRHASPELREKLDERTKAMRTIMQHAKGVMAQIDAAPTTARTGREQVE